MIETLRLSLALGLFVTWIDAPGNLRGRQRSADFRRALLILAEYMLRKQGFARNYGQFPCARMEIASWVGLPEWSIRRCIPVLIEAGVLVRMSELVRRRDLMARAWAPSKNLRCHDKWYCPHQYLLGATYSRILRPEFGTEIAVLPAGSHSAQDKLSTVGDSKQNRRAQRRKASQKSNAPRPGHNASTTQDRDTPTPGPRITLEEAAERLQAAQDARDRLRPPLTKADFEARHQADLAVQKAQAELDLAEMAARAAAERATGPKRYEMTHVKRTDRVNGRPW